MCRKPKITMPTPEQPKAVAAAAPTVATPDATMSKETDVNQMKKKSRGKKGLMINKKPSLTTAGSTGGLNV